MRFFWPHNRPLHDLVDYEPSVLQGYSLITELDVHEILVVRNDSAAIFHRPDIQSPMYLSLRSCTLPLDNTKHMLQRTHLTPPGAVGIAQSRRMQHVGEADSRPGWRTSGTREDDMQCCHALLSCRRHQHAHQPARALHVSLCR